VVDYKRDVGQAHNIYVIGNANESPAETLRNHIHSIERSLTELNFPSQPADSTSSASAFAAPARISAPPPAEAAHGRRAQAAPPRKQPLSAEQKRMRQLQRQSWKDRTDLPIEEARQDFEFNRHVGEGYDRPRANKRGEVVTMTQRCIAMRKSKPGEPLTRCENRTTAGCYCHTHLQTAMGLRVRDSTVPNAGKGVFAMRDFAQNEKVCKYTGDLLYGLRVEAATGDDPDNDDDFEGSTYILQLSRNTLVDAARRNTNVGRFINDTKGTRRRPNVKWVVDQRRKTVEMRATRPIKKGDELFVSYGSGYFEAPRYQNLKKKAAPRKAPAKVLPSARPAPPEESKSDDDDDVQEQEFEQIPRPPTPTEEEMEHKYDSENEDNLGARRSSVVSSNSDRYVPSVEYFANGFVGKLSAASAHGDPRSMKEALSRPSPEREEWIKAIQDEKDALNEYNVYTIIDRIPAGVKAITVTWVFKTKRNADRDITRRKVRMVVQGFKEIEGLHFDETYAPVVHYKHLRMLLASGCHLDLEGKILDIKSAYLNAELDKEIYIMIPTETGLQPAKLNKALYGLKQAGRLWNQLLEKEIIKLGWNQCKHTDKCVFWKMSKSGRLMFLAVFVDDIPHFFHKEDAAEIEKDKAALARLFTVSDLGDIGGNTTILNMRVRRDRKAGTLSIDQEALILRTLDEYGYTNAKTRSTPMCVGFGKGKPSLIRDVNEGNKHSTINADSFRAALGVVLYASNAARPDIAHAATRLASEGANPSPEAILGLKNLLRYLREYPDYGLVYHRSDSVKPVAYCDANWGDLPKGRSSLGILIKMCGGAVDWSSKKSPTVCLSTSEAEYIAASEATRSIVAERNFLIDLKVLPPEAQPTTLYVDNINAITMTDAEGTSSRRKHIHIRHHYIREQVEAKNVAVQWISTEHQEADIFTKPLPEPIFTRIRDAAMGHITSQQLHKAVLSNSQKAASSSPSEATSSSSSSSSFGTSSGSSSSGVSSGSTS
jgi:hypothetical protein